MTAAQNLVILCAVACMAASALGGENLRHSALLSTTVRSPVILIPGTGGSHLEAKLDKKSAPHFFCEKKADWFEIWLDPKEFLPGVMDCWTDNMKMTYDKDNRAHTADGVTIRPINFGQTDAFEWSEKTFGAKYFLPMVEALEAAGYTKGKDLRGAPYDFRFAAFGDTSFLADLKALVEETYSSNGEQRVVIVAHSMGGLMTRHFLAKASPAWKAQYVRHFVSLGSPFKGATSLFSTFASGYDYGQKVVAGGRFRAAQITYQSNFWLMPVPHPAIDGLALVTTPTNTYTVNDIEKFMVDIGYIEGALRYREVKRQMEGVDAPGVSMTCMYGTGVDTHTQFEYGDSFEKAIKVTATDGDGTVSTPSASACVEWSAKQQEPVNSVEFKGVNHSSLVQEKVVFDALLPLLMSSQ